MCCTLCVPLVFIYCIFYCEDTNCFATNPEFYDSFRGTESYVLPGPGAKLIVFNQTFVAAIQEIKVYHIDH